MAHLADVGSVASSQRISNWPFSIARSPTARNRAVYQRKLLAFAASRAGAVAGVAAPPPARACLFIYLDISERSPYAIRTRGFPGYASPTRDLYASTPLRDVEMPEGVID